MSAVLRKRAVAGEFQHQSLELTIVEFVLLAHVGDGVLQRRYSPRHLQHQ